MPYEVLTGNTPDISELLDFKWFQHVWYYEPSVFPEQNRKIARWIGIAHRVGQAMCFWILPISGEPIARTTIQAISQEELATNEVKQLIAVYDTTIQEKFDVNVHQDSIESNLSFRLYCEDELRTDDFEQELIEPDSTAPIIDEIANDAYDELLHVEQMIHCDGEKLRTPIVRRKCDADSNPIGQYNANPLLNSRIYLAEFPDGHIQELSANTIVEAVYNQVDGEGFDEQIFQDIVDHRYDSSTMEEYELEHIHLL